MAEPYAAYELVRKLVGNVEVDVIKEAHDTRQRVLGRLAARGGAPSQSWVYPLVDGLRELIEAREKKVIEAVKKALRAKPPQDIDDATSIQITNFVMSDVGRYLMCASQEIKQFIGLIKYFDGIPPDLHDEDSKIRQRITGEIEVILAEVLSLNASSRKVAVSDENLERVFIVHGRNEEYRREVAQTILSFGLEPVVLHEQPNKGRTIIEKFEDYANVGFAIVILSGDDVARLRLNESDKLSPRARQNVILEFGFFLGRLGRANVCALYESGVELPSDYDGVLWLPLTSDGNWKQLLRKELEAAGLIPGNETRPVA